MPIDNEEIRIRLANDLDGSFELFMEIYQHDLYNFVWYMLHHPQDAEDVLQETFLKAYRALSRFSAAQWEVLRPQPWITAIARNLCIDRINQKKQTAGPSIDTPERDYFEVREDQISYSLEGAMERNETNDELHQCIQRLPLTLRTPVILHYILEIPYREIATILDQPLNTVKSNGYRGFKMLQMLVQEQSMKEEVMVYHEAD